MERLRLYSFPKWFVNLIKNNLLSTIDNSRERFAYCSGWEAGWSRYACICE